MFRELILYLLSLPTPFIHFLHSQQDIKIHQLNLTDPFVLFSPWRPEISTFSRKLSHLCGMLVTDISSIELMPEDCGELRLPRGR